MDNSAGMLRARAIAVVILLVSYGALGARQPAVRTSVPLPIAAGQLASTLGLDPADKSQLIVSIVRLVFDSPDGTNIEDQKRRKILMEQLGQPAADARERVPLPLDPSIWRETLLTRPVRDSEIISAILSERTTALLYHGLAALDDDTLAWLGPDRETLLHLRRNAGTFAVFGRSVRVRGGRVSVPGGPDAEPVWSAIVGADPARPAAFVQRLIRGNGRLAWFYDTVAHLDANRQHVLLGPGGTEISPVDRVRELLDVFETAAPEWHTPDRPFVRPPLDPSLVISLAAASGRGTIQTPGSRRTWDAVFRDESIDASASAAASSDVDRLPIEPAWLARRISLVPGPIGRRRLETFLFAQRVFSDAPPDDAILLTALRGTFAFPALALTLERMGLKNPSIYAAASRSAALLNGIRTPERRRTALAEFQGALAIIERAARMRGIGSRQAADLAASLIALPISADTGYGAVFTQWLRQELIPALPLQADSPEPIEESILAACAGVNETRAQHDIVEWEGRRYRVDPAAAELRRLHRVRDRQNAALRAGPRSRSTLDARLSAFNAAAEADRAQFEQGVADTLVSIVYALHLGEPDGAAVSAGNAAGRHEFEVDAAVGGAPRNTAWQLPREEHDSRSGWRVRGSLLGLDVALSRLALRRLDLSDMPGEPTLATNARAAGALTAALFGPITSSVPSAGEIASAIERGRTRVRDLQNSRSEIERIAKDAGLSEWRREALAWAVEHERGQVSARFSLVELFWLGSPRAKAHHYDAWGAASSALDGCLCLRMPEAEPWELRTGRSSTGYLATRGADVALRVAEFLAESKLPAAIAPGVLAYAMQDVLDNARPAYFDDWPTFERTARNLPTERLVDHVAALAAGGALVPITPSDVRQ